MPFILKVVADNGAYIILYFGVKHQCITWVEISQMFSVKSVDEITERSQYRD